MDLNYLLKRQQEERSRAEAATSEPARRAHEGLASEFEDEIRRRTDGRLHIVPVGAGSRRARRVASC